MPERHNALKLLLCLDVGGWMDEHVRVCEQLFSAARSAFKHLQHFYFHNFPYEKLWKDNGRRAASLTPTERVLRSYGHDYRVIFVGAATMSPYEITQPGGSIEHWNGEAGVVWMQRLCTACPRLVWRIRSRRRAGRTAPRCVSPPSCAAGECFPSRWRDWISPSVSSSAP